MIQNRHTSVSRAYSQVPNRSGQDGRILELGSRPADRRLRLLPQVYRSLGRQDDVRRAKERVVELAERHLELNPSDAQAPVRRLLAEHLSGPMPGDGRVDEGEYRTVLTEAVGARNGWKRILRRCAPRASSRST